MYSKAVDDVSFDFRRPEEQSAPASEQKPAAEKGSAGSLSYALHPLVVINISDHATRVSTQSRIEQGGGAEGGARVFGVLIGEQSGRRVEIANSFEIKVARNGKT